MRYTFVDVNQQRCRHRRKITRDTLNNSFSILTLSPDTLAYAWLHHLLKNSLSNNGEWLILFLWFGSLLLSFIVLHIFTRTINPFQSIPFKFSLANEDYIFFCSLLLLSTFDSPSDKTSSSYLSL